MFVPSVQMGLLGIEICFHIWYRGERIISLSRGKHGGAWGK
jgi:hypothetical protein